METLRIPSRLLAVGLLLLVVFVVAQAQDEEPQVQTEPQGELSIEARVSSKFSYQGVLKEGGNPVTGNRTMVFRLHSNAGCTSKVGSDINLGSVPVQDGLFTVELAVNQGHFDGQALWLQPLVGGTAIGCQAILPVPYALSLRPGATISSSGSIAGRPNLQGDGWELGDYEASLPSTYKYYGVRGEAKGGSHAYGVEGRAERPKHQAVGLHGWGDTAEGTAYGAYVEGRATGEGGRAYGVYAKGTNGDVVLGGKEGMLRSDPEVNHSYLNLVSDDQVEIHLDNDKGSGSSYLAVYNEAGTNVFEVDEESNVSQTVKGDGLVKAAANLRCRDGTPAVYRWFNNVADDLKVGAWEDQGVCWISFEFSLEDRYWTATSMDDHISVSCRRHLTGKTMLVCVCSDLEASPAVTKDAEIMVVVY